VIPIFIEAMLSGKEISIDGDGSQSQEYEQESILNQILSFFVPDNLLYQVNHGKFCAIVSHSSRA